MSDDLTTIIGVPSAPIHLGRYSSVRDTQKRIGFELPDDYVDVACRYGSGGFEIGEMLSIRFFNPFDPDYTRVVSDECAALRRGLNSLFSDTVDVELIAHAVFPDPEGLLPILSDDSGNWYCYLQTGPPNQWPLGRIGEVQLFEQELCSFLVGLLREEIQIEPSILDSATFEGNPNCSFGSYPLEVLLHKK